ncbi:MAG: binding-protein-dependent transport system inner rane protein [Rhizobium sp.]|nr:binding-protein-dependent transport system inner rane protein [Rhizobium sp.]
MSIDAVSTPVTEKPHSAWNEFKHNLGLVMHSATFLTGAFIVLFWVCCAIFGRSLIPYDPFADEMMNALQPPSAGHWFGTDQLGRDVFSRVIAGARDILTIAPLATLLSTFLGTALGLTMGYFGGWIDEILSRLVDAVLALPTVIVALLALTALGTSTTTVLFVIGFTFAPIIARTVRAAVLAERDLDYVSAAELRRENRLYIMFVEILPNVVGPILVESTVRLGYSIFTVATLSFIGFGIQPPSPDWGLSISANYGLIGGGFWWTVLFDSMAIASLVIGVNLMADGIQSALDD